MWSVIVAFPGHTHLLSRSFFDVIRMLGYAASNIYMECLLVLRYQIICARYSVKTLEGPSQFYFYCTFE